MEEPLVNFEVKGLPDEEFQKVKEYLERMQKEHPEYCIRDIKLEKRPVEEK
ncbi:hypothetical protein IJM86_09085 [bacterium]|nr:hypothetical protein [bacterium]